MQIAIVALGACALLADALAFGLPGALALGALTVPAGLAYAALLFVLQQQGFVFRWREQSTKVSLDELGIFVGILALPPALVVLAVFAASLANQAFHRRAPLKAAFNVAQYTIAALVAVAACVGLARFGVPAPWHALPGPLLFAALTAFQVSLVFGRLERISPFRVFVERFGHFVVVASGVGASLGLVVYALYLVHPAAVLAAVPIFYSLRRFGRLSEWADAELATHRLVAGVSAEVAGRPEMGAVADRVLDTCGKLFDCGEATLVLAQAPGQPTRTWQRHFGGSSGFGGVSAEVVGAGGARVGALTVFPKAGQHRYGEREHQLLRTVAASAAAAAANAEAIRAAGEANRELAASEARYRSLFDTAHVLIHVLDADGRIVDANPAARAALGHAEGEPLCEALRLPEQLRAQGEVVGLECTLTSTEGRPIDVLLDARSLAGDDGRFVVFARDITTLKKLEAELRRSMAGQHETIKRLENMNRELEEFTLWTTHDMREPLRSIGTIAGFLHEDLGTIDTEEARDMARRICAGAERLKERVKALHAFSLIVQRDDEFQDVDMEELIENVVSSLEAQVAEKGAGVEIASGPFPVVRAQPHRLHQVFANLVENALKYGRAEDPVVTIGFEETSTEWRFHVRDNGPGVPPGYHDRIFQLFQRGPDPKEGGSGAGLAIVKRIAEQHGGRAWVESPAGRGACFYVAIPKPRPVAPLVQLAPIGAQGL